jgi:aspartate/glutamate racemase
MIENITANHFNHQQFLHECIDHFEDLEFDGKEIKTINDFLSLPEELIDLLVLNINKLKNIGSDFVAISSNTPHIVIDKVRDKVDIPIINVLEETRKYVQKNNLRKLLLTGTLFTMNSTFYQKEFDKNSIECIVPDEDEKKNNTKYHFS